MRFARDLKRFGLGGLKVLLEIVPNPHADLIGMGASRWVMSFPLVMALSCSLNPVRFFLAHLTYCRGRSGASLPLCFPMVNSPDLVKYCMVSVLLGLCCLGSAPFS